jgi:hypothetical protein
MGVDVAARQDGDAVPLRLRDTHQIAGRLDQPLGVGAEMQRVARTADDLAGYAGGGAILLGRAGRCNAGPQNTSFHPVCRPSSGSRRRRRSIRRSSVQVGLRDVHDAAFDCHLAAEGFQPTRFCPLARNLKKALLEK